MNKNKIFIIILILLSLFLFTYKLGTYSLWDNDEPLYSQIAREFNHNGDILTTYWNGEPWFCHPPLSMWLTLISGNLLGWNEFSVRLPSAVCAVLIVLMTYYIGRRLYDENTGFIAGLILATSLQFFVQAKLANLDMLFTLFLIASTYVLYRFFQNNSRMYLFLFWVLCGFGTLAKGPFAVCLPPAVIFLYLFFSISNENECLGDFWGKTWTRLCDAVKKFIKIFTPEGVIAYLILGGFWYAAGLLKYKTEFYNLVFKYFILDRVITPVMNQSGPIYYYLIIFAVGFFPWVAFFLPSIIDYIKTRKQNESVFLLVWLIFTFVFFSLVQTKLPNYILFIYPACAIMLARYFNKTAEDKNKGGLFWPLAVTSLFYAVIIGAFVVMSTGKYPQEYAGLKNLLLPLLYIIIATLVLSWTMLARGRRRYLIFSFIGGTFLLYVFMMQLMPAVDYYKPIKPLALQLKSVMKPREKVAVFIEHFNNSYSFVFYLNEKVALVETGKDLNLFLKNNKNAYLLVRADEYEKIKKIIGSQELIDNLKPLFHYDKYLVCRKR